MARILIILGCRQLTPFKVFRASSRSSQRCSLADLPLSQLPWASALLCPPAPAPIRPPSACKATSCGSAKAGVSPGSLSAVRTQLTPRMLTLAAPREPGPWMPPRGPVLWEERTVASLARSCLSPKCRGSGTSDCFLTGFQVKTKQLTEVLELASILSSTGGSWPGLGWEQILCHLLHFRPLPPQPSPNPTPPSSSIYQTETSMCINHCGVERRVS